MPVLPYWTAKAKACIAPLQLWSSLQASACHGDFADLESASLVNCCLCVQAFVDAEWKLIVGISAERNRPSLQTQISTLSIFKTCEKTEDQYPAVLNRDRLRF